MKLTNELLSIKSEYLKAVQNNETDVAQKLKAKAMEIKNRQEAAAENGIQNEDGDILELSTHLKK